VPGVDSAEIRSLLDAVDTRDVEFATMRPQGSEFATLDRRVVVVSPPELAKLAKVGDANVLDTLIDLLRDPARAWASEVALAAMTRREEKEVEAFAARPDEWWDTLGEGAHERWQEWLDETRERLLWDESIGAFVESEP